MADEVSTGELARRLDSITQLLQKLVSREEYTSDQKLAEHRFTEIERDLEAERAARRQEIKDLREQIAQAAVQRGTNWRQGIYSGLVPSLLVLTSIVVTVVLALRSGGR